SMLPNNTISAVIVLNKNNFGSVGYSAIRIISIKTKKTTNSQRFFQGNRDVETYFLLYETIVYVRIYFYK
ncbi:hypothetical protein JV207_12885, partial [Raoultella ornithinolytica]|uniref:hypothetical protein n=1 Tax=Raoultella ornithinolytica TaxID=54291 RepID=UPI0019677BEC